MCQIGFAYSNNILVIYRMETHPIHLLVLKTNLKLYYLPATRMINWHEKKAKKSNDLCIITVPAFPTQPNEKYSTTIAFNPPKSVKRRSTKISSRSQIDDFA